MSLAFIDGKETAGKKIFEDIKIEDLADLLFKSIIKKVFYSDFINDLIMPRMYFRHLKCIFLLYMPKILGCKHKNF